MSAFFQLHRDLPREGPGEAADVLWALAQGPAPARVTDAACGPGADTETLAGALPQAQIVGIDAQPHFVAAAQARCVRFGARVRIRQGDMRALPPGADLIWCAGAAYMLGIGPALALWRAALAPKGRIAFSEPVLLADSAAARSFWAEYPALATEAGIAAQVRAAGFRTLATRRIVGAPWAAYYLPLEARIAALRPGAPAELTEVLDRNAREIALWRQAPQDIAYLLSIVAPA